MVNNISDVKWYLIVLPAEDIFMQLIKNPR